MIHGKVDAGFRELVCLAQFGALQKTISKRKDKEFKQ
jgi:hypothetical protein